MIINGINMIMTKGDSESLTVKAQDIYGNPVLLGPGDIVYFTVKIDPAKIGKSFQKIVTEFFDGLAEIHIRPEDTKNLKPGPYYYDIQVNFANGEVKTIIPQPGQIAKLFIAQEVTYE